MEWLKNLSNATDYMKDNLDKIISYDEAPVTCRSIFYFQQMFSYVA